MKEEKTQEGSHTIKKDFKRFGDRKPRETIKKENIVKENRAKINHKEDKIPEFKKPFQKKSFNRGVIENKNTLEVKNNVKSNVQIFKDNSPRIKIIPLRRIT